MFGRNPTIKEGVHVFAKKPDGKYSNFIYGVVTGVEGEKLGVNGLIINPVGLKNKVDAGKAGPRSEEILKNPNSENCIFALIYRIEQDNFTEILNTSEVELIPPRTFAVIDGWIRESLPELINNVLSLPPGAERDQAKRTLKQRYDTLLDKNLKKNLYSICRSLKILN